MNVPGKHQVYGMSSKCVSLASVEVFAACSADQL